MYKTEKTVSIVLFVVSGLMILISIGLYAWAGIDSTNQLAAKIGCSLLLDFISAGLLFLGIKMFKN